MDGYNGKKVAGGPSLSRNSDLSFRDANHEDRSFQCCNRIGCSARQSSIPSIRSTPPEKPRFLKPPFRFKNSKSSVASSSSSFSSTTNFGKYYDERQNHASSLKEAADVAESSNRQAESGDSFNWDVRFRGGIEIKHGRIEPEQSSGSTATASSRYGKQISRRFGSAIQDTASSLLRRSSALRCATHAPKTNSPVNSRQQNYSLNNLGCASISDVLPLGSSSGYDTRDVSFRRKLQVGEGSSKAILAQPDQQVPQEESRQTRIQTSRDIVVSRRTRYGSSGLQSRRMRLSEPEYESTIQLADPVLFSQPSSVQLSAQEDVQESSQRSFSSELSSVFYDDSSFNGRAGTGRRSSQTRLISGSEDRDDYRRFNIEGIAEILLALERIEQDEELTDEQLMVLEANLFLGGLSFYDQHRDMRLDIDNMSYEELLALEEEMGTVSTALSEEAISKCLKRSLYRSNFTFPRSSHQVGDVKCSICQEEYVTGEEMGSLQCEHRFHAQCIRQWLRLKNWCPICKAAAASYKNKPQS